MDKYVSYSIGGAIFIILNAVLGMWFSSYDIQLSADQIKSIVSATFIGSAACVAIIHPW